MYVWIGLSLVILPIQFSITAPYGRHYKSSWGAGMSNRWGWVIMEAVSILMLSLLFLSSGKIKSDFAWFAYYLWSLHYLYRSFIFPFRTRTKYKKIPISIVASAIFFNVINAGTNGYFLGYLENYTNDWFTDIRFIIGLILFIFGATIHIISDNYLIQLRKGSSSEYKIPRGGLFEYISCPNHLGEMIEWIGFALMCWNLPALGFASWTMANLIPRAWSHHKWYKKEFSDYPSNRKALIPGIL
ncbi:MAG: DUF1295 domain-containing protein [Saprospiraceae bacterium]|nr:DUF1295 domain-containing protein [Saprospiraceae bacterium]